jgi:putative phosphoesterase
MRVAALYDIHGNLPALEAVLEDVRAAGVDEVVVGGDVLPGPMSRDVLARLLDLDVPVQFIRGNCEVAALAEMAGRNSGIPEAFREAMRWSALELDPDQQRLMASWPKTLSLDVDGLGRVLFCHGTPRDENECFTRATAEERLLPIFEGLDAAIVVCGHTHMQFDRAVGRTRVVNAGSVGMPFGEPGGYWLLLGPDLQLRRTAYDLAAAAARIGQTSYPQAASFAAQNVLQPPSETAMLDVFSKAELISR